MTEEINNAVSEVWLDIPNFSNFQVSNFGRVKSKAKCWTIGNGATRKVGEFELKYSKEYQGGRHDGPYYKRVKLQQDGRIRQVEVHTLVAEVFIGPKPIGYQVDHIDRDTLNNNVSNLHWVTPSQNCFNRSRRKKNGRRN